MTMRWAVTVAFAAVVLAADSSQAQQEDRRWVVGDHATLRAPDPLLDAFCKQAVPVEAANGLAAPNTSEQFGPWLARLKTEKPAIAKCYDPGIPLRPGSAVMLLDSNDGCGGAAQRVRLADGRIGCVYADFLSVKPPSKK